MKQILPQLRQIRKHLTFAKRSFTRGGFRHVCNYIDGLIAINRKTINQISKASIDEEHHAAISRILNTARVDEERLEADYLRKLRYLTRGPECVLIIDDTLSERNGKAIASTQYHKDHSGSGCVLGHQFFTAIIKTPMLQLPLFPRLYSKESISKIEMARRLVEHIVPHLRIKTVLFDSWYSDKKLIQRCLRFGARVVCCVKTNRKVSHERGSWDRLSTFSKRIVLDNTRELFVGNRRYQAKAYKTKLRGISAGTLVVAREYNERHGVWSEHAHLFSTRAQATPVQVLREYQLRWSIEVFHRDIKQCLGFRPYVRTLTAVVRHAIFVVLAYVALRLYLFAQQQNLSIGEGIARVQNEAMNGFVRGIVEIEDKEERLMQFENLFIRKTAKV